mmetsp:Transcript_14292/g.23328  ORF Transcript_14292/g.23328 Transcript_14292/m.23328 type:complete len:105 (-) Transcript_14292:2330-2644(-)
MSFFNRKGQSGQHSSASTSRTKSCNSNPVAPGRTVGSLWTQRLENRQKSFDHFFESRHGAGPSHIACRMMPNTTCNNTEKKSPQVTQHAITPRRNHCPTMMAMF